MLTYRREIDGLRAVAVVPVILFHAGFAPFAGGFVGVDVFFVISGYLITSRIVADLERDVFSLADFYERRARRILPALFVVLAACLPFAWAWLLPRDLEEFARSLVAVAGFGSNIFFWRQSGYFDTAAETKPLLHTWSLGVEEQFYLLFPLLLVIIWRLAKPRLSAVLLTLAVASLAVAQWGAQVRPGAAFYLLPTRGWELLVGALLAVHLPVVESVRRGRVAAEALGAVGVAMIAIAMAWYGPGTPFPGLPALLPTLGTALVIAAATPATTLGRALGHQVPVGIGLVSYGAYLWHQPLFAFARYRDVHEPTVAVRLLLAAVAVALAYLTWRMVELPARDRARFGRGTVLRLAVVGAFLLALLGGIGVARDGFAAERFTAAQRATMASASLSPMRAACHAPQTEAALRRVACRYFGSDVSVAVVGNSHATELALAFAEALRSRGVGIAQYTISGCRHDYGVTRDAGSICARWHARTLDQLRADRGIHDVVLSYRNESFLADAEYRAGLVRFADALQRAGKRVHVVLQAPSPVVAVNRHLQRALPDLARDIKGRTRASWDSLYFSARALRAELPREVDVVDPADALCDAADCFVTRDGVALFFDDNHLSVAGAALVVRQLEERIPAPSRSGPPERP